MLANAAADKMLSAASRRKTVLSIAASSSVSGGTRRVFVFPGIEALAMTAIAHTDRKCQSGPSPMDPSNALARRLTVKLTFLHSSSRFAIAQVAQLQTPRTYFVRARWGV